jgi:diguanylate cyclase (GGDEF)-like protein
VDRVEMTSETAYRLRTVRIAVDVTFMAVALLAVFPFVPGHPHIDVVPYVALLVVAAVAGVFAAWSIPWPRVFAAGWGDWAMYVWSALDIALVTCVAAAAGGPTSELIYLYALTTIFFAASYPGSKQVGLFALTCVAYMILVLAWTPHPPAALVTVRLGTTAMVWFMAAFLSRERGAEMAAAVRSRRLAEHRADLLAAVAHTAASITTLDAEQVMSGVADSLVDLGFDVANFCVLEDGGRRYRVRHARGLPDGYASGVHSSGVGMVALVAERHGPVVVQEYESHPLAHPLLRGLGVRAVIAAPIWLDGQLAAVLVAGKTSSPDLPTSDSEVFEILAAQVGRSLESAHRFEAEQEAAEKASADSLRDELTGVGNRRRANALLDGIRPGDALLLLDLDHFKHVNDDHGHAAGDAVLEALGSYLRDSIRDQDDVARYGGEEFLVIFRDTSVAALPTAQRLHDGWSALHPLATFSGGVAVHTSDQPATITIGQADAALYAAKQTGRDRICEFSAELQGNWGAALPTDDEGRPLT